MWKKLLNFPVASFYCVNADNVVAYEILRFSANDYGYFYSKKIKSNKIYKIYTEEWNVSDRGWAGSAVCEESSPKTSISFIGFSHYSSMASIKRYRLSSWYIC